MKRKPLSYAEYLKKLNKEIQRHPNYREGMRVDKINANLLETYIPGVDPKNPDGMNKLRDDIDLQMVVWDCKAVLDKTYSYTDNRASEKMLQNSTFYRNSKEGRGSVQVQSRLKSLYDCIIAYKQECGSWPAEVAPLIEKLKARDPWDRTKYLKVEYKAPPNDSDHQQVLAEYTREGKRKFALYVDGHQETWKIQ